MRPGSLFLNAIVAGGIAAAVAGESAVAQSRNNPYSPSPDKQQTATAQSSGDVTRDDTVTFRLTAETQVKPPAEKPLVVAQTVNKPPNYNVAKSASPTDIYKIGIGDVLFVKLKNASNGSGYVTVRPDGTIDYPLAGDDLKVLGQTVDAAAEMIRSGIRLFAAPDVEVKVREYGSHKITVGGSVENGGEKSLQREAIPLFAIRADAVPAPNVSKVRIKRSGASTEEVVDLRDPKADELLIFPGDRLFFDSETVGSLGSYFISGEVGSAGQKEMTAGLTLYQAVTAAGGAKDDSKKAIIRRKNADGTLAATEHNLRSIKSGKAQDPSLTPGDIIEIRN